MSNQQKGVAINSVGPSIPIASTAVPRYTPSSKIPIIDAKEDRMEVLLKQMQDLHLNMIKSQDKPMVKNERANVWCV